MTKAILDLGNLSLISSKLFDKIKITFTYQHRYNGADCYLDFYLGDQQVGSEPVEEVAEELYDEITEEHEISYEDIRQLFAQEVYDSGIIIVDKNGEDVKDLEGYVEVEYGTDS